MFPLWHLADIPAHPQSVARADIGALDTVRKSGWFSTKKHRKTASKNHGWDDAVAYIDEMLADNRKYQFVEGRYDR